MAESKTRTARKQTRLRHNGRNTLSLRFNVDQAVADACTPEPGVLSFKRRESQAEGRLVECTLIVGSEDDRGVVGAVQPEVDVPGVLWAAAMKSKGVAGMVESGRLSLY